MKHVKLRQVCVMASDRDDLPMVAKLAESLGTEKFIPCFGMWATNLGYHPWASHTITLDDSTNKRAHYAKLFGEPQDSETIALFEALPEPKPLQNVLQQLESLMTRFDDALLGEVGLDRSFCVLDPREGKRQRTQLRTPIAHQLAILRPQIDLACRLGRSVSLHSVCAAGHTMQVLDELRKEPSFAQIILKAFEMFKKSIRITINHRQKNLTAQIQACRLDRLLSESDQSHCNKLAECTMAIVELVASVRQQDVALLGTQLAENFQEFRVKNRHSIS